MVWPKIVASVAGLALALQARGATASAAEEEDPRPRAALSACASGDVKKGVAILAELYAQTRNPSFVFNQGRCYQQNGQLESAAQRFTEYLRIGTSEAPADLQRAQGFVKEIEETLARRHPAEATAPVVVAPAPASTERQGRSLRITGVALTVLGVAAVGTGVFLSFKVRALQADVEQRFAMMGIVTDPGPLQRQLEDGGRFETWQWISYGVGLAALAGAVTTFVLGGSPFGAGARAEQRSVALIPVASPGTLGALASVRF